MYRKFLLLFLLILPINHVLNAQTPVIGSDSGIIPVTSDPTGVACSQSLPNEQYQGTMYTCKGGVWTAIGGGGPVAYSVIAPSGDTTGVTDNAAIQAAITAGTPVQLQSGNYYITGLTCSAPCTVVGANAGQTFLQMVSTTNNFFTINYGGGQLNTESNGTRIANLGFQYKSGVTPTAGYGVYISGKDASNYLSGVHIENNQMWGLFGGIYTGPYMINNWFTNNQMINFLAGGHGGIYYDTPSPAGDAYFDGDQLLGVNTGVLINQADTMEFTNLKLNQSGLVFSNGGNIVRVRIINPSIEGNGTAGSNPTCGINIVDYTKLSGVQVFGGAIDFLPTAVCGLPSSANGDMVGSVFSFYRYTAETPPGWVTYGQPRQSGQFSVYDLGGVTNTGYVALLGGSYPAVAGYNAAGTETGGIIFGGSGSYLDFTSNFYMRNTPNGGTTVLHVDTNGLMYHNTYTVATLPTCNAATVNAETMVTDATAFTAGSAPTGGSDFHVPVYCQASGAGPTYAWIMY